MRSRSQPPRARLLRRAAAQILSAFAVPALLAAPAPLLAPAASAQLVDSGAFLLLVDGRQVGTEQFDIRRIGSGDAQQTLARGTAAMRDGRVVKTVLQVVGSSMALDEYEVSVTGAEAAVVRLVRPRDRFQRLGDRLQERKVGPDGERMREYRAGPATVVLERGIAHHYFLLGPLAEGAHGAGGTTLDIFAPLADDPQSSAALEAAPEMLRLGGGEVATTRVRLGAGAEAASAWFDGSGRLVRVAVPAEGFVAERVPQ